MSVPTELGGGSVSSSVGPLSQAVKPALDWTAPRSRQLSSWFVGWTGFLVRETAK